MNGGVRSPQVTQQNDAFYATNKERVHTGRVQLRPQQCLQRFAVRWAKRMAKSNAMVHQSLWPILRKCKLRVAGENIAYGFSNGQSLVTQGWMRSPSHRSNILDPDYRVMGIGAHRDAGGTWWVSQVFGRAA